MMPVLQTLPNDPHFPPVESKTLDGRAIRLPADLPGERTVLILGFSREEQPTIEAWAKGMQQLDGANLPWLQLLIIDNPNAVVRAIVNGGMRHSIRPDIWPHIVALYTAKAVFECAVGIDNEEEVHVLVVDSHRQYPPPSERKLHAAGRSSPSGHASRLTTGETKMRWTNN